MKIAYIIIWIILFLGYNIFLNKTKRGGDYSFDLMPIIRFFISALIYMASWIAWFIIFQSMNPYLENKKRLEDLHEKYNDLLPIFKKKEAELKQELSKFSYEIGIPVITEEIFSICNSCDHTYEDGESSLDYDERSTSMFCNVCNEQI